MRDSIGAIVLDGGRGSRLAAGVALPPGGKGAIAIGGGTLFGHALEAARAVAGRTVVVAAPGRPSGPLPADTRVVHDRFPGAGPLAAIADGLDALLGADARDGGIAAVVVVAGDMALVRPALLESLVARLWERPSAEWVVPWVDGRPQVLLSALRPRLRAAIRDAVTAGVRAPTALLERLAAERPGSVDRVEDASLRGVDPDLASLRDVDTPGDLEAVRKILASRAET